MIRVPGRRVRYALLVAGTAAAFLLAAPATPASAAPPVADLNCAITLESDIHPGTTPQLHHQTSISQGLTGNAICTGTVNAEPVTGTGTFLSNGHVISTCTHTTGTYNFVLKIPTASGTQTLPGRYTLTFPPIVFSGDLVGTAVITSRVGDCVTTPLTHATAVLTGHIT